jgi:hypothetical protein
VRSEHHARIEELLSRWQAARDAVASYQPVTEEYSHAIERARGYEDCLWTGPSGEIQRLREGRATPDDVDYALAYLELDPYYFWSGYTRAGVVRHLAHAALTDGQRDRARQIVLRCVDGTLHSPVSRLAGAVANNWLRRELRRRLHSDLHAVAHRALTALSRVKHPGLTRTDLDQALLLILAPPRHGSYIREDMRRCFDHFWTPEWEPKLRDLAAHHGPHRAIARQLVARLDRSRARRARPSP